jgi:WD40 repeat protein
MGGGGQSDRDVLGLTPCRDLSSNAVSVASAPDTPNLLVTSELGASLISADGFRVERTFAGQLGKISAGVLGADGSWGATIGDDDTLRIFQTVDGKERARVELESGPALIAASPSIETPTVAVADAGGELALVDARSGAKLWSETLDDETPASLLFEPGAATLLVRTASGFTRRSTSDGSVVAEFTAPSGTAAALSADGALLAIGTNGSSSVTILNASDGSEQTRIAVGSSVLSLVFSPDARELVAGTASGAAVYELETGSLERTLDDQNRVHGLALSSDGETLVVATTSVDYYRLSDGEHLANFGSTGFVWEGTFAADGRLQFPGVGGPTEVWDAASGVRLGSVERSLGGNQGEVLFSPDGLLVVNFERSATFWDMALAESVRSIDYETSEVRAAFNTMIFSRDGAALIGEGAEPNAGEIRVWDATNGALLRTLPGHGFGVVDLALSADGETLVSAGAEDTNEQGTAEPGSFSIKLWEFSSGELERTLEGHTGAINSIALSPDGTLLLSSDSDGLVRLWSTEDGSVVRNLASGSTPISVTQFNIDGRSVAFSPDGTLAASAGTDWTITHGHTGVISIWSVADGSLVGRLLSLHEANLGAIQWSPDGALVFAGVGAGARIWCLDELPEAP